jgi:hypothetical protein
MSNSYENIVALYQPIGFLNQFSNILTDSYNSHALMEQKKKEKLKLEPDKEPETTRVVLGLGDLFEVPAPYGERKVGIPVRTKEQEFGCFFAHFDSSNIFVKGSYNGTHPLIPDKKITLIYRRLSGDNCIRGDLYTEIIFPNKPKIPEPVTTVKRKYRTREK